MSRRERGENIDWTDERIEQLKSVWVEGHAAAEIGRRMGISKSSAMGKVHRLELPMRPSPIKTRNGDGKRRQPPLPGQATSKGGQGPIAGSILPPLAVVASLPGIRIAPAAPKAFAAPRECQWPLNDGGPWIFCCAETMPGKPYCAEHVRRARASSRDVADAA